MKTSFVLQHHWWKKPRRYMATPPLEHWDLRLDIPANPGLMHFYLEKDPTKLRQLKAVLKPWADRKWMTEEGRYPPGTNVNPSKDLPAIIDTEDRGEIIVIQDAVEAKRVEFKGNSLTGIWSLTKDPTAESWTMKRE